MTRETPVIFLVEDTVGSPDGKFQAKRVDKFLISAPNEETVRFWLSSRRYVIGESLEKKITRLGTLDIELTTIDYRH